MNLAVQLAEPLRIMGTPPSVPRHPNLPRLRKEAEAMMQKFARVSADVRKVDPEWVLTADGVALDESWRVLVIAGRTMVGPAAKGYERFARELARYFPKLASQFRTTHAAAYSAIEQLLILIGHRLGTSDPELESVDFSIPVPDPAPRGPSVELDL